MTQRTEYDYRFHRLAEQSACCDWACYEDPGCACTGCRTACLGAFAPTKDPDPIRPPDTDEAPDFGLQEFTRGVDRSNRERARDLALTCFALLAILAIVLWWTQR
jgi:hypothetical protein